MKRIMFAVVFAGIVGMLAATSEAGYKPAITNWVNSYKLIPSSCTNVGTTGLSTGKAYMVFAVTNMPNITEATAGVTNDVRLLIWSMTERFYEALQAKVLTNRPTRVTITKKVLNATAGDVKFEHAIETELDLGTVTIPSE